MEKLYRLMILAISIESQLYNMLIGKKDKKGLTWASILTFRIM